MGMGEKIKKVKVKRGKGKGKDEKRKREKGGKRQSSSICPRSIALNKKQNEDGKNLKIIRL